EAVCHLHNSETNCGCYELEQGKKKKKKKESYILLFFYFHKNLQTFKRVTSPHNEGVTSHLLRAMSASPDFHDADHDDIVSACKTYYETVRRNFRYKQPDVDTQKQYAILTPRQIVGATNWIKSNLAS
ncbi:hypothetical protein PO909_010493, partial [Leuciscus waleckii]